MGWYGTPEGETKRFEITRDTIREVKERWKANGQTEDDTTEGRLDGLDESRHLGAEDNQTLTMAGHCG